MPVSWTAANTVAVVLVLAFVALGVGALLLPARLLRRCPECRSRTLERTGNRRDSKTWMPDAFPKGIGREVVFREREYRCRACGATSWQ